MRRIVIALGATLSGLVLLFSWPTSLDRSVGAVAAAGSTGTTSEGTASDGTASDDEGSGAASSGGDADGSTGAGSAGSATSAADGTYDGAAVSTRYGDVQVRITVSDGVVTDAVAVAYPDGDRRDQEINAYAIPVLQQETLTAQSASIDMISGATVTSRAYVQSLQDALDQAGL